MIWGKNILILVPHPDDEVVACSAAISRAQSEGAEIFALYLTHGCVALDVLWPWQRKDYDAILARRRSEAENVAKQLKITPVGWCKRPARTLWQDLEKVFSEIVVAMAANKVDQVWVPAFEGGNADHDALNALGHLLKRNVSVIEFAEYNFFKGRAHSQTFPYPNGTEHILQLTQDEKHMKRDALRSYKSEANNLNYVDIQREACRPLADYDYSQPPHPGTLWYNRFQWVPFRHPRVDFTKPAEVTHALSQFLAGK
jgi:LmbE family N-acetylglucosaminyl deacetylase